MSSTFQDQITPLQHVIDALGSLPVKALVTVGPALDVTVVRSAPNVTVVASAPHRQVLRDTAVVITHGGHGTVVKALAAGVPMVLMPHGRDQADTAVRVVTHGAGVALTRSARPDAIGAAVRQLLENPSYRAAAQRLGETIRRDAASDLLVTELEAAATSHRESMANLRRTS
jgi:UDP:flavonoid glycosyltransferase YjiC (YdhE family)